MQLLSDRQDMDDLAAQAVALGRQIANRAKSLHLGDNARDVAFVSRCLGRLKERQPFDARDEGGLDAVMDILDRSIVAEYLGSEDRFEETGYDEFGPHGEIREMLVYSDRGEELIELRFLFQDFLNIRESVLDQVAAHRCLLGIMNR
ncbi:hypothetical protein [Roseovarius sp. M141]|uniref:hypothetical protein n=1 Tax=Roseovarius sp. M141 TaxID=2583806 RepID=UPI0020CE5AC0|nr:hypothetical protein [Roseovarius sp. M141]MCQ0093551.1 hypothetical protein [Roseovarius sp. M141]